MNLNENQINLLNKIKRDHIRSSFKGLLEGKYIEANCGKLTKKEKEIMYSLNIKEYKWFKSTNYVLSN